MSLTTSPHPIVPRARRVAGAAALAALALAGCTHAAEPPSIPAPGEAPHPELPAVPDRAGALSIDVVYPPAEATLGVRDSTFVFGSTGTGASTLTINGASVDVAPNGAFLAFLPVPADGVYRFRASAAGATDTLTRTVNLPEAAPSVRADSAAIVAGSVTPRGAWVARPGERIVVSFRGTPGGRATLVLPDGRRVPMVERTANGDANWGQEAFGVTGEATGAAMGGVARYEGYFDAVPLLAADTALRRSALIAAADSSARAARVHPVPVRTAIRRDTAAFGAGLVGAGEQPVEAAAAGQVVAEARGEERPVRAAAAGEVVAGARAAAAADSATRAARNGAAPARVELVLGRDTARARVPLTLSLLDPARPLVGVAVDPGTNGVDGDSTLIARPGPGLTYHWFWPDGTRLELTGERDGYYRVQLTDELSAWASSSDVRVVAPGTPPPAGRIGTVRFAPDAGWIDVRVAMADRLPFRVDEDEGGLTLTVYGGTADTDWLQYGGIDPLITRAAWETPADDVYRLRLNTAGQPWGYRAFWTAAGLTLRVRRPPQIDRDHPLRGVRVAVDAGHPPGGAIGPTRLQEAEANLAVASKLAEQLRAAGAQVLMTRTDTAALGLYPRPYMAEKWNADVLISIHNNAFPDGVNPFENNGTSVYYFQPQSEELARDVEYELLAELGLRNLGIGRANLILARPTWMPAILSETMFLMLPRQEAALRDPGVQARIAAAHVRALETFLKERGR